MRKRRVVLICSQHLFGESIEMILRAEEAVELIGPFGLDGAASSRLAAAHPDVAVIVDDGEFSEQAASLTATLLEAHPELPVIRVGLSEKVVRVHSTHLLPARGADLIETIRRLPVADSPPAGPKAGAPPATDAQGAKR